MYCPKCGTEQASFDTRFCVRCGFLLVGVTQIIANNGNLPVIASHNQSKKLLTRRNVFVFGLVWFMFLTFLLLPIAAILVDNTRFEDTLLPLIAILGAVGGPIIMVLSLFFESSRKPFELSQQNYNSAVQNSFAAQNQNALPPQNENFTPANFYADSQKSGWRDTGELKTPSSVTENTTKFLEMNDDK